LAGERSDVVGSLRQQEIVSDVLYRIPGAIDDGWSESPDMPEAYLAVIHEQIERVGRLAT
jgi:hypothetical protein